MTDTLADRIMAAADNYASERWAVGAGVTMADDRAEAHRAALRSPGRRRRGSRSGAPDCLCTGHDGPEGDDLASYNPRTVARARTALSRIRRSWSDVTAEDISAAASAWVEDLGRATGRAVDPPTATQLAEAVEDWSPARTAAARPLLVPEIAR